MVSLSKLKAVWNSPNRASVPTILRRAVFIIPMYVALALLFAIHFCGWGRDGCDELWYKIK